MRPDLTARLDFHATQTRYVAVLGIILTPRIEKYALRFDDPPHSKRQWNDERRTRNAHLQALGMYPHQPGRTYPLSLIDLDDDITEALIFSSRHHPSFARIPGFTYPFFAYVPADNLAAAEAARSRIKKNFEGERGIHVFELKSGELTAVKITDGRYLWNLLPNRDRRREKETKPCLF